ncbi:MAG: DnaJ like chaperone protein [Polaribacter sp.]|jgi:DnaJ like chaperone protein
MKIWGKVIGGFLGFLIGNIFGLFIGVWIGNSFDRGLKQNFSGVFTHKDPALIQRIFFKTTFSVMGHIAKADGIVSQKEIEAAEQVMAQLGLDPVKRKEAMQSFAEGKESGFDLNANLSEFITNAIRQPSLIQMFLEIQILAAVADGSVNAAEKQILYQIGQVFRLPTAQIDRLVEMVIAQQSFHQEGSSGRARNQSGATLEQAYKVIGVSANSNKQEVKRAYRKLMSQHHPDKLVAKGMPKEMLKVATEKSQEIQAAYEMIKQRQRV